MQLKLKKTTESNIYSKETHQLFFHASMPWLIRGKTINNQTDLEFSILYKAKLAITIFCKNK